MKIDYGLIGWALQSGVFAFLNPCGFAMLPSYVSQYLRSPATLENESTGWARGMHGLKLGLIVSVGFFTVFVIIGLAVAVISSAVGGYLPWVAAFVGLLLIAMGLRMLVGGELTVPFTSWAGRFFSKKETKSSVGFYYLYGVGYAIASCGCTLSIFLAVVLQSLAAGLLIGIAGFLAYASGMALMMLLLSLGLAYSKGALDRTLPLKWALGGLVVSTLALLFISWKNDWGSVSAYENNQLLLLVLAPALVLSLFFQMRHWEFASRVLNAFILIFAGTFTIYYQLFYSGIVNFTLK